MSATVIDGSINKSDLSFLVANIALLEMSVKFKGGKKRNDYIEKRIGIQEKLLSPETIITCRM